MQHLSVSWHITPLKFSNWNIICFGQKEPINVHFFQTFGCSNESSPNSSCHFWNRKVRVYSNFASQFSVMKDNSSVFFWLKPHVLWTKIAHRSEFFGLLIGWVKMHQIPHNIIFETTSQFFFKVCITLQCHARKVFCTFVGETLYDFYKRSPPKCKISDF